MFVPVPVAGDLYVDGGIHSPTNADLLVGERYDRVIVVSPMSTDAYAIRKRRLNPVRLICRAILGAEVRALRKQGAHVEVFQPGLEVQRAMGINALDSERCSRVAELARESALARLDEREPAAERLAA